MNPRDQQRTLLARVELLRTSNAGGKEGVDQAGGSEGAAEQAVAAAAAAAAAQAAADAVAAGDAEAEVAVERAEAAAKAAEEAVEAAEAEAATCRSFTCDSEVRCAERCAEHHVSPSLFTAEPLPPPLIQRCTTC